MKNQHKSHTTHDWQIIALKQVSLTSVSNNDLFYFIVWPNDMLPFQLVMIWLVLFQLYIHYLNSCLVIGQTSHSHIDRTKIFNMSKHLLVSLRLVVWDYSNPKQKSKHYKQKTFPQSHKPEIIKILTNHGLA